MKRATAHLSGAERLALRTVPFGFGVRPDQADTLKLLKQRLRISYSTMMREALDLYFEKKMNENYDIFADLIDVANTLARQAKRLSTEGEREAAKHINGPLVKSAEDRLVAASRYARGAAQIVLHVKQAYRGDRDG